MRARGLSELVAADAAVLDVEEGDFEAGGVFGVVGFDLGSEAGFKAFAPVLVGCVLDERVVGEAELIGGSFDGVVCS